MRIRWTPAAGLLVAISYLSACSTLGGLIDPAGHLLAEGREAFEQRELDAAYDRFSEIRTGYPESPESREAFPLAAAIFQYRYYELRHEDPGSRWLQREPGFLFAWLDSFGPAFPRAEAEALFLGMPYGLFREYQAHRLADPRREGHAFRALDDNGIIEELIPETPAP